MGPLSGRRVCASFSAMLVAALVAGVAFASMAPPARATTGPTLAWAKLTPATSPTVRSGASMAYDTATGQLVLFGGPSGPTTRLPTTTWVWSGTTWTKLAPSQSPPGRSRATMAYDAHTDQLIVFGGLGTSGPLSTTWSWNGSTWTKLSPSQSPPERSGASMAYDAHTGQLIVFGGLGTTGPLSTTWSWNGSTWTKLAPSQSPPERSGASMAYDAAIGYLVLIGGSTLSATTWIWNGTTWTKLSTATRPLAHTYAPMAYDASGSYLVLFGGGGPFGFTTTWALVQIPTRVTSRIYGQTPDATAAAELEHQFSSSAGDCPGTTGSRPVILATDATYPDALSSAYLARYLGTGTLLTPPTALSSVTLTTIHKEGITKVDVVGGPLAVSTSVVDQLESIPADVCGGSAALPGTVHIQVTRIWGATQYATAEKIAEIPPASNVGSLDLKGVYFGRNATGGVGLYNATGGLATTAPSFAIAPTAILANGKEFQDAEAASTVAYAEHLPILLTTPSSLSPQTSSAIGMLGIEQMIVLGGPLAVSNGVVSALQKLRVQVIRIAGADYTATAVELARFETAVTYDGLAWAGTGSVSVARGNGFSDALAGAVVVADGPNAITPEPVLLTVNPTTVGTVVTDYLRTAGSTGIGGVKVTSLTVLGGPLAITTTVVSAMQADLVPPG